VALFSSNCSKALSVALSGINTPPSLRDGGENQPVPFCITPFRRPPSYFNNSVPPQDSGPGPSLAAGIFRSWLTFFHRPEVSVVCELGQDLFTKPPSNRAAIFLESHPPPPFLLELSMQKSLPPPLVHRCLGLTARSLTLIFLSNPTARPVPSFSDSKTAVGASLLLLALHLRRAPSSHIDSKICLLTGLLRDDDVT